MLDLILSIINSAAAVFVILGLCIFFHELGHFAMAKLSRMKVEEFAFGLGPIMTGIRRGETLYAVRWIPFGGLVRITGMEPGERDTPRGFFSRPRPLGALTIFAGVFMNVVLALGLFFVVNIWEGAPSPDSREIYIGETFRGQPAEDAGLLPGDRVIAVDGETESLVISEVLPGSPAERSLFATGDSIVQVGDRLVSTPSELLTALAPEAGRTVQMGVLAGNATSVMNAPQIRALQVPTELPQRMGGAVSPDTASAAAAELLGLEFDRIGTSTFSGYIAARPEQPVVLTVQRDGQTLNLQVVPRRTFERLMRIDPPGRIASPITEVGRIGITLRPEYEPVSVPIALQMAAYQSVGAVVMVVDILAGMVTQKVAAEPSGPVGIIAETARQASLGWSRVLSWGGLISANLAVINLLPIPPFDGFWLILIAFEGITRRPVNPRIEMAVRFVGIIVILLLFAGLVGKDLWNILMYRVP